MSEKLLDWDDKPLTSKQNKKKLKRKFGSIVPDEIRWSKQSNTKMRVNNGEFSNNCTCKSNSQKNLKILRE